MIEKKKNKFWFSKTFFLQIYSIGKKLHTLWSLAIKNLTYKYLCDIRNVIPHNYTLYTQPLYRGKIPSLKLLTGNYTEF